MRMKELVEESGLPRTTIHHYQREGLLPPGRKTAANAAIYGPEHVERLRLIQALRTDELGPFPLDRVRAILAAVDAGSRPDLVAALHALPGVIRPPADEEATARSLTLAELAKQVGLSYGTVRDLAEAELIVGTLAHGDTRRFDPVDAAAARLMAGLLEIEDIRVADLEPLAELTAEATRYERALVGLATARLDPDAASERSGSIYRSLHALSAYLYVRMTSWSEGAAE